MFPIIPEKISAAAQLVGPFNELTSSLNRLVPAMAALRRFRLKKTQDLVQIATLLSNVITGLVAFHQSWKAWQELQIDFVIKEGRCQAFSMLEPFPAGQN